MLLALGALLGYHLYVEYDHVDAFERERLSAQARVVDENMARKLDAINRTLVGIRSDLPRWGKLKDGREHAVHHLKMLSDAMIGVRTLLALDAHGITAFASREALIGADFSQREYFQAARRNPDPGVLYVSPPFRTVLGVHAFNVSRAIIAPDGRFAGIVSATLDPEEFEVLLNSVRYAPDMWSALVHGDGQVFMIRPQRENVAGKDLAKPGTFFSLHRDSGRPASTMSGVVYATGEERMIVLRTIQPAALRMDKPMVVAVTRDWHTIFAAWRHDTYWQGGLYAFLVLASVFGLYFHQRRQRQSEAVLLSSQASMNALLDNTPYLMWLKDGDSRFVAVNKAFVDSVGKTSATEIIGKTDFDLWPREEAERYRAEDVEVMTSLSQKLIEAQEIHHGQRCWMEVFKTPILNREGKLLGTAGFARDINERRDREQQRLAEAVAQRDTLVREVHHRIKNNLQGVAGLLRLELGKYLEMNPRLEIAIGQVNAIATVHGLQSGDSEETILLSATVSEICRAIQQQFQRPVVLWIQDAQFGFVPLQIDKDEAVSIALVLNELILNAVKHTPPGGIDPQVKLLADGHRAQILIRNSLAGKASFNFDSGRGVNTGLRLVRSLLPKEGVELSYEIDREKFMVARLVLTAPVVGRPVDRH